MKADKIHAEIVYHMCNAIPARLSQRDTVSVSDTHITYTLWNTPIITIDRQTGKIEVNNEPHDFSGTLLTKRRKKHIAQMLEKAKCATCNMPSDPLRVFTFPQHHCFAQYCYTNGKTGAHYICRKCDEKYTMRPYTSA